MSGIVRRREKGSLGLHMTPGLLPFMGKQGLIAGPGMPLARHDYRQGLASFDRTLFGSKMSEYCIAGDLDGVELLLESNACIDFLALDSDFKLGYLAQVVLGYITGRLKGIYGDHARLFKFLCGVGCPVNQTDIVGNTVLFYALVIQPPNVEVARTLVECGADVNHRNRFGTTILLDILGLKCRAMMAEKCVRLLLENGADLEIRDPKGISSDDEYRTGSPKVVAVVENWKRKKRSGVEAPLYEKKCVICDAHKHLQSCGRCRLARYCSRECQADDWGDHKDTCFASQRQEVVVVRPRYDNRTMSSMTTSGVRGSMSSNGKLVPRAKEVTISATNMIVKVSTTTIGSQHCIRVYDRRKAFSCIIREEDDPEQFSKLEEVVRTEGTPALANGPGVRSYFCADLDNPNELRIKVGIILADQPF